MIKLAKGDVYCHKSQDSYRGCLSLARWYNDHGWDPRTGFAGLQDLVGEV